MSNLTYYIKDKEANRKATIATIITALLILLALIFITFSVNAKQENLEEGILVNFGTSNVGSGKVQPQKKAEKPEIQPAEQQEEQTPPPPKAQLKPKPVKQPVKQEPVLTQKKESTVVTKPKETQKKEQEVDPKKSPTKETTTPSETANDSKETETKPVEEPKPAPKQPSRVYGGKTNVPSGGEGTDNTPGDKGQPDGSPEKGAYEGRNSGLGDSGVGFSLSGRKLLKEPSVKDDTNIQGKITINIKVDQNGNVISASLGKPTTITSNSLIQKSIAAAKLAKFDANRKASEEQFGTMTFVYKVE